MAALNQPTAWHTRAGLQTSDGAEPDARYKCHTGHMAWTTWERGASRGIMPDRFPKCFFVHWVQAPGATHRFVIFGAPRIYLPLAYPPDASEDKIEETWEHCTMTSSQEPVCLYT